MLTDYSLITIDYMNNRLNKTQNTESFAYKNDLWNYYFDSYNHPIKSENQSFALFFYK